MGTHDAYWSTTAQMGLAIGLALTVQWRILLGNPELKSLKYWRALISIIYFLQILSLCKAEADALSSLSGEQQGVTSNGWMTFSIWSGIIALIFTPSIWLLIRGFNYVLASALWLGIDKREAIRDFLWEHTYSWQRRKFANIIGKQLLQIEQTLEELRRDKAYLLSINSKNKEHAKLLKRIEKLERDGIDAERECERLVSLLEIRENKVLPKLKPEEIASFKRKLATLIGDFDHFEGQIK